MTDGRRRRDSKYRSAARHRAAWHLRIGAGSRRNRLSGENAIPFVTMTSPNMRVTAPLPSTQ
jgi:hypothetical protein